MENNMTHSNELQHHGIRGMRWGVRRYQNKDGSLTPAGQKRYNKEMDRLKEEEKVIRNKERTASKLSKLDAKKKELDDRKKALEEAEKAKKHDPEKEAKKAEKAKEAAEAKAAKEANRPKKLSEMTDDEVRAAISRIKLEQEYNSLTKPETDKGESFVREIGEKALNSAVSSIPNILDKAVNKVIDDQIKKNTPVDEYSKLQKQYNIARVKKDIDDLTKNIPTPEYEALKKQYDIDKIKKDIEDLKTPMSSVDKKLQNDLTNLRNANNYAAEQEKARERTEGKSVEPNYEYEKKKDDE